MTRIGDERHHHHHPRKENQSINYPETKFLGKKISTNNFKTRKKNAKKLRDDDDEKEPPDSNDGSEDRNNDNDDRGPRKTKKTTNNERLSKIGNRTERDQNNYPTQEDVVEKETDDPLQCNYPGKSRPLRVHKNLV
mmetsp:Transcript_796/g.1824  ORF Transcript_796/g.1824 Transcript_796/m.1824 type:complete len:136 (-) Transcript_796:363-770(-)